MNNNNILNLDVLQHYICLFSEHVHVNNIIINICASLRFFIHKKCSFLLKFINGCFSTQKLTVDVCGFRLMSSCPVLITFKNIWCSIWYEHMSLNELRPCCNLLMCVLRIYIDIELSNISKPRIYIVVTNLKIN